MLASLTPMPPLVSMSLVDGFYVTFELAFSVSLLLTVPVVLWQLWRFLSPALFARERRLFMLLLLMSSGLFFIGLLVGWQVGLPCLLRYAQFFVPQDIVWMLELRQAIRVLWCVGLYTGLVFQVPLFVFVTLYFGWIPGRVLRSGRPYVFLMCLVVGMLVTPPDMFAQLAFALPVYALFEFGFALSWLVHRWLLSRRDLAEFTPSV